MEDFPWPIVAMVFIAFISWLKNRIDEAAAARRERREERAEPGAYEVPEWEPSREAPVEAAPPIPRTFRQLLEHMEELSRESREEPAPKPVAPPPLPPAAPPVVTAPPVVAPAMSKRAKPVGRTPAASRKKKNTLVTILRQRDQLRAAFVLSEVLAPPKGNEP